MTPDEMRAARGLINISLEDLSRDINISIERLEKFEGGWSLDIDDHRKIKSYFEGEGVEFAALDLARDPSGFAEARRTEKAQRWRDIAASAPLPRLDGGVDIIPSRQSRVIASGLDYRPRPSFQEYSGVSQTPSLTVR